MGDHRVSIKIQFEMHDHKAKDDFWLNWSDGIPERISTWVQNQKEIAMDGYLAEQFKDAERREAEAEEAERKELERLKGKYEPRQVP